jgi:hypothetical protein
MAGVLQHLRSSTLNKRPNPASMVDGQVAINYASGAPGMFFKDSNGSLVKVGPVHVGSGAPNAVPASGGTAGNSLGEQWLDTSGGTYVFKIWDGAAWRSEAGEFVNATGDTMTGDLVMNNANVVFEGSVDDGFETTLTVVNPTADRTITLPNVTGTVVTTGDSGTVTSTMIADGTIVDADVNASAAIAGSKISPNFGSQNSVTTGTSTAASFIPTSNTAPTNGVYLPSANNVAISTNGTGRLFVDASGNVGIGTDDTAYAFVTLTKQDASLRLDPVTGAASILAVQTGVAFRDLTIGSNETIFQTSSLERMRLDSGGRLGLGTSSPVGLLDVRGEIKAGSFDSINGTTLLSDSYTTGGASFGSLCIERSSGAFTLTTNIKHAENAAGYISTNTVDFGKSALKLRSTGLFYATASASVVPIGDSVSLTDKFVITNGGSVGIGITSPGNALHVVGSIQVGSTSDTIYSSNFGNYSSASDLSLISGSASLLFKTGAANDERARIDTSGRLLVGTSSARLGVLFEIEGTSAGTSGAAITRNSNNSAGPAISFSKSRSTSNGTSSFGKVSTDDVLGAIDFYGADGSAFINAASISAQADGDFATAGDTTDGPGRLVFSTTADGASSPTERMRVTNGGRIEFWGGSTVNTINCVTPSAAGTTYYLFYGGHSSSGAGNFGTQSFGIWSNGNVINTNNSYGAISDLKLKENIVDSTSQWDDIKALQIRKYNFKEGQTHTQIGLIAQEVELVSPGLVSESPDRDKDGNDLGTVTKSVNYSVLYMKAVKALQEAMERIEVLEQRLADAGIA